MKKKGVTGITVGQVTLSQSAARGRKRVTRPTFTTTSDQSGQGRRPTNAAQACSALPSEAGIAQRDRYVCFDLKSGH